MGNEREPLLTDDDGSGAQVVDLVDRLPPKERGEVLMRVKRTLFGENGESERRFNSGLWDWWRARQESSH